MRSFAGRIPRVRGARPTARTACRARRIARALQPATRAVRIVLHASYSPHRSLCGSYCTCPSRASYSPHRSPLRVVRVVLHVSASHTPHRSPCGLYSTRPTARTARRRAPPSLSVRVRVCFYLLLRLKIRHQNFNYLPNSKQ